MHRYTDPPCEEWPALSALIDRMLDQPRKGRRDWILGLTGPDAALAPRLFAMLDAAEGTSAAVLPDTLPKLAVSTLELDASAKECAEDAGESVGDEIGPYRLVRLLGRGGMGNVWYAERCDGLMRRAVALKLPLTLGNRRELAARFAREREIIAGLVHPHIARLYDAGISAQGQGYLALEYVEGQTLDEYCNERRLDLRARIALFCQVLDAVQYAHGRLVVHRDLKPTNILVDRGGQVRLLDFGVAKILDDTGGSAGAGDELTRLGPAGMTLAYASPEQVTGKAVTTATDIYSLGVVLFELLLGARPYRLKRESRAVLEEAVLRADIPLPSAFAIDGKAALERGTTPSKLRRALRADLDAVLLKALQRDSQLRYESAGAFAGDLAHYLEGRPVCARHASRGYQLQKFLVRNRYAMGAAGAGALALTLAAAIALVQAGEARHQAHVAQAERDRALAAAEHREAVDDFLSDLLLEAGRTGKPVSVASLITRADELSAREFAANPEARAAVLQTVGRFHEDFNGYELALSDFDRAQAMLGDSPDKGLRGGIACERAMLQGALGRAQEYERGLREIIGDESQSADLRSDCLGDLAHLAFYRDDGVAAKKAIDQALLLWQRVPRRSPVKHARLLLFQAEAYAQNGQPAQADARYRQVLEELRDLGRDRGVLANTARNDRIAAAIVSGDLLAALALIDEMISIQSEDFPDRPQAALRLYERGAVLANLGRDPEALSNFGRAAVLAASQDPVTEQRALFDAAAALSKMKFHEAAEQYYRRASDLAARTFGEHEGSEEIPRMLTRAKLDLDLNRPLDARTNLTEILQLPGVSRPTIYAVRRLRSQAFLAAGNVSDAKLDAELALDLSEKLRGDKPYSFWVAQAQVGLAHVLSSKGDAHGARDAYRESVDQFAHSVGTEYPISVQAKVALSALISKTK